jgi:hypothetical protein
MAFVFIVGGREAGLYLAITVMIAVSAIGFSNAFAAMSTLIACGAAALTVRGVVDDWRNGWRVLCENGEFNIGLDIHGVMLGAFFLASLCASPPIW